MVLIAALVLLAIAASLLVLRRSRNPTTSFVVQPLMVKPIDESLVVPVRFIAPSHAVCRSVDLSVHAVPNGPANGWAVATAAVTSTRECQLGSRLSVTPLNNQHR